MTMLTALKEKTARRSPIGVDVGFCGVRTVQLTRRQGGSVISAAQAISDGLGGSQPEGALASRHANAPSPNDAFENVPPSGPTFKLTHPSFPSLKNIAYCRNQGAFVGRVAVAGLSPPDVEFHAMELPPALLHSSAQTVDQIVHTELMRLTAHDHAPLETRHWWLPARQGNGPNVMGVATPTAMVRDLLTCCRTGGLNVACVDAAPAALARFFRQLHDKDDNGIGAVLDVGFRQARLIVCVDNQPVLIRCIGAGGGGWTHRIAEALDLSPKAAEVHKRTHGIGRTSRDAAVGPLRTELSGLLLSAIRSELTELATQVKRSFEYVLSAFPDRELGRLLLVGGGSLLKELPVFLRDCLGIEVALASQVLNEQSARLTCDAPLTEPIETYATAIGLAL